MNIRDILLYLDTGSCEQRIDIALNLAGAHNAPVTGISFLTHDYYQPRQKQVEEALAATGEYFQRMGKAAGVAVQWRGIESAVVGTGAREMLIRHSHCSDLVIVGQEPRRGARNTAVVEALILGAGRPVLVVPSAGSFSSAGTRILVAWRNGREAARAVSDALPLLKMAQQVTLLSIASPSEADRDPWGDILGHLQRHGIDAQAEQLTAMSVPPADSLLNMACEGGFDLLVMGAFSAPSRRAPRLGPVADQILREMTVPVLFSH